MAVYTSHNLSVPLYDASTAPSVPSYDASIAPGSPCLLQYTGTAPGSLCSLQSGTAPGSLCSLQSGTAPGSLCSLRDISTSPSSPSRSACRPTGDARMRSLSVSVDYISEADPNDNIPTSCRRLSVDSYEEEEEEDTNESSCGSTLLTHSTRESCITNPTSITHERTHMVSIPLQRLRRLEYLERNMSTIIHSAVEMYAH